MSNDQPQWARDEAANLAIAYIDWLGRNKVDADAEHVLAKSITQALLAAEQRGAERMRERAAMAAIDATRAPQQCNSKDRWVEQIGQRVSSAIRSLETSE